MNDINEKKKKKNYEKEKNLYKRFAQMIKLMRDIRDMFE